MLRNVLITVLITFSISGLIYSQTLSTRKKADDAIEGLSGKIEFDKDENVTKVDLNKLRIKV